MEESQDTSIELALQLQLWEIKSFQASSAATANHTHGGADNQEAADLFRAEIEEQLLGWGFAGTEGDTPPRTPSLPPTPHGCIGCFTALAVEDAFELPCIPNQAGLSRTITTVPIPIDDAEDRACVEEFLRLDRIETDILGDFAELDGPELLAKSDEVRVERETLDKTYCSNPTCSAFIPPGDIFRDTAACRKCGDLTCSLCKQASHGGVCPRDEASQQVLGMALTEGWQRCPTCQTLVELNTGCNHMTCRCGQEFCYVCGGAWRGADGQRICQCPHWEERNIVAAQAEDILDREGGDQLILDAWGQLGLDPEVEDQQVNHRCEVRRHQWQFRRRSDECENCHHDISDFIFECNTCGMIVCKRCRRYQL
ncbi:hypothetical protein TruAng_007378 [Truncatella angustata]|nr:hypothetical protein TruAng_007378 [Truncatella angustata]